MIPRNLAARAIVALAAICLAACQPAAEAQTPADPDVVTSSAFAAQHEDFESYWYQGQAEMSRYDLQQRRYGETHAGEAVSILVTEDFLTDALVKHEFGPADDAVSVLKHNAYRRFYTGVYPYTIMTSSFTPADGERTLKAVTSVQEWCGLAWLQFEHRGEGYDVESRSYFQREGDTEVRIDGAWLEDELVSHARIDPASLPVGELSVVPAGHHLRMAHLPLRAQPATATRTDGGDNPFNDAAVMTYTLRYHDIERAVAWTIEVPFPHRVVAWSEYEAREPAANAPATHATLTDSIMLDYWRHHDVDDAPLRDALGLTM